jgi:hypothetical protein
VLAARDGPGHFSSMSSSKRRLDAKLPAMPPWVIHDLRRTAKTLMGRARVPRWNSELVLGHSIPGVEGIYDQHEYFDEKAEALAKLAALVKQIVIGADVIPLKVA